MENPRRCPRCGTELTAGSPEHLCPRCLLQAGLESQGKPLSPPTAVYTSGFAPPTPEELSRFFPQLEILELLGKGGMGAVYKARQPGLDRLVALKILPPDVGADPAFAERFTREARALAKLSHPHIVAVFDFGQSNGLYYFLMEYVDGVNIRQALRAGNLKAAEALKIVPQICDALQFAHDEGVVHRDIKPENILLDKRGRVKIADFGLAKLLGAKADRTLTGTHQVMGTPHYMAPEQIQGTRDVDHRADIYSLGVTFYEMLTGELPLGRFAVPSKKVHIDVRLDEVVLRTLEVEPDLRYQHASDVKTKIEEIGGLAAVAWQRAFGLEYRSQTTLLGVPLVHIAYGLDPKTGRKRVARGIIALGDLAIGAFACGGVALGGVAFGGVSVGLVSLGGLAVGLLAAIGGLALGSFAFGGLAVGGVALGGVALGYYAAGGSGLGVFALLGDHQDPQAVAFFEAWVDEWPRWVAWLGIGLPVLSVLLYLFVWCVFRFLAPPPAPADESDDGECAPPQDKVAALRRAGAWLLAGGIITLAGWIPSVATVVALDLFFPHQRIPQNQSFRNFMEVFSMFHFLVCALCGTLIIQGGMAARAVRDLGRVRRAGILSLLPLSPAWLVTLPVGIWLRHLLAQPDVQLAFDRNRRLEKVLRDKEANEPGWAFVFGWFLGRLVELLRFRGTAWPRVAAVVAGLVGASMLIHFWVTVEVSGNVQHPPFGARAVFEPLGYELWQGWAACAGLFLLACLALATMRLRETRWPSVALLLGALAVTGLAASVIAQPPLPAPELRRAARGLRDAFPDRAANKTDSQILDEATRNGDVVVRCRMKGGILGALGMGAALILLAAVDLNRKSTC